MSWVCNVMFDANKWFDLKNYPNSHATMVSDREPKKTTSALEHEHEHTKHELAGSTISSRAFDEQ